MIRRFNYTGRIKIPRNRIDITLVKDDKGKYFTAKINLEGLDFPPDAKVIVEPNYKGVYQRFYFGTAGRFKQPSNTRLSELPETELAYFDISVVDEKEKLGLILGKARGIAVSADGSPSDRIPLLYVNPADLKNQLWKLTFESGDDGRPVLEINRDIPNFGDLVRTDIKFTSLVYPIAFRGVLQKIIELGDFDTEEDSWVTQWLKFITKVLEVKTFPELEKADDVLTFEQEAWIDECVNSFCKKLKLFEKFIAE